jgi:ABC-type transporter Mla subunit MlaD
VLGQKDKSGAGSAADRDGSLADAARTLSETREALRQFETSALADVAQTLSEVAESLARTTRELSLIQREEWADAEGIRLHLKRTRKQFERIAPHLPRHYVSERGILYNVREVDEWLMDR